MRKFLFLLGSFIVAAATPVLAQDKGIDPEYENFYLTQRHGADWKSKAKCDEEKTCVITTRSDNTILTSTCGFFKGLRYCQTPPPAVIEKEGSEVDGKVTAISLSNSQKNAVRSARAYLETSGFSRRGLIEQLSSQYGSGYSVTDATVAVDSLNVDWNSQAERSAKAYLETSGFSCSGLVEQLSSEYGNKYTPNQAAYGARQAGAC